jgi:choline/glycine/proline betaine transport protein
LQDSLLPLLHSGSLVVDNLTSGGKIDAPVDWALAEGGVAAVLLIGGGLQALQTATIPDYHLP